MKAQSNGHHCQPALSPVLGRHVRVGDIFCIPSCGDFGHPLGRQLVCRHPRLANLLVRSRNGNFGGGIVLQPFNIGDFGPSQSDVWVIQRHRTSLSRTEITKNQNSLVLRNIENLVTAFTGLSMHFLLRYANLHRFENF